jgi:hypothetical protein
LALSVITSSPLYEPRTAGLNCTVIVHDEPPVSRVPQVVLATEKLLLP